MRNNYKIKYVVSFALKDQYFST